MMWKSCSYFYFLFFLKEIKKEGNDTTTNLVGTRVSVEEYVSNIIRIKLLMLLRKATESTRSADRSCAAAAGKTKDAGGGTWVFRAVVVRLEIY